VKPDEMVQGLGRVQRDLLGVFNPQLYTIGLFGSPGSQLFEDLAYPIDNENADTMARFSQRLTLYHESVHFAQFTATNFGLDNFRALNLAYRAVVAGAPWDIPMGHLNHEPDRLRHATRIWMFDYYGRQMSLSEGFSDSSLRGDSLVALSAIPFHAMLDAEAVKKLSYPEIMRAIDSIQGVNQPRYFLQPRGRVPGRDRLVECNAAALFEGYAFLLELHHYSSAFPALTIYDLLAGLDFYDPIYTATSLIYLFVYNLPLQYFLLHQAALIDIALMYTPLTVHNISPFAARDEGGEKFEVPFSVFLRACEAAQSVAPMTDWKWDEQQRYQDAVCSKMGIPTTTELAEMGIARLEKMGINDETSKEKAKNAAEDIDLFRCGYIHYIGLKRRVEFGTGFFSELFKTKMIREFIENARLLTYFFDLSDYRLTSMGIQGLGAITIGTMLSDMLRKKEMRCPLREGRPVFCVSAEDDDDVYCTYKGSDGHQRRCPFEFFREMLNGLARKSE
jgi:hypothetical protein